MSFPPGHDLPRESGPFAALSPGLLDQMHGCMTELSCDAGEALIRQGDPGEFMAIVVDGTARASVRTADGRQHEMERFGPDDVVGEMALLTGEPRNADVVAETTLRVLVLRAQDFHDLASRHSELGVVLTALLAARLGQAEHDGLSGKVVGEYRIRRCIGRGGMAIVYEAEHVASERRVALKMMNHRLTFELDALARFRREARIAERLRHDNIVSLLEQFSAYRTQFLVLEYCDGPDLEAAIRRHGRLSEDQVRPIIGQLALALDYVHGQGILHRDIKPSNVLLSAGGVVKLADFGVAKPLPVLGLDNLTQGVALFGTPAYLAPELLSGNDAGVGSDLYALACTTFELLAGRSPFAGSGFELMEQKRTPALPDASEIGCGVSDEMFELLRSGLAPRPEDREIDLSALTRWSAPVPAELLP